MRLHKVQALGLAVLAVLAVVQPTQAAGLTRSQRAQADRQAERALAYTTTEPRAFRVCIREGYRVYTRSFIGRACVAPDGERWYAGLSNGRLVTGP